ncbi:hypothetical protein Tco_0392885 [Tanacetum coccineum]
MNYIDVFWPCDGSIDDLEVFGLSLEVDFKDCFQISRLDVLETRLQELSRGIYLLAWMGWNADIEGRGLVSKAFRVFNTRRQQTKETCHITFDESHDAIKFSKPSVDNINIDENERYLPDEYLHPYAPSQRYQTNNNDVSFIEPYECPEPVVLETKVSSDQNGYTDQNDHNDQNDQSVQNDEILNDDHFEHSNHTNDEQIIDNLPKTEDI